MVGECGRRTVVFIEAVLSSRVVYANHCSGWDEIGTPAMYIISFFAHLGNGYMVINRQLSVSSKVRDPALGEASGRNLFADIMKIKGSLGISVGRIYHGSSQ